MEREYRRFAELGRIDTAPPLEPKLIMLRLQLTQASILKEFARQRSVETCAAGLVFPAAARGGEPTFTVRELWELPDQAYTERSATAASLRPEFCTQLANRARAADAGVLLVHTHLGDRPLEGFSSIDDQGEVPLAGYFGGRLGARANFAAVFTADNVHARVLGAGAAHDVALVGKQLVRTSEPGGMASQVYDRQVRAFGRAAQKTLAILRVGVVGLGGTGSVIAQQLAHLGVGSFLLADPDVIEVTNLNRIVGATPDSLGQPKVAVACKQVTAINPRAECIQLQRDVVDEEIAEALLRVDFIFCCTDSMASRAVLNQLAYQYLIPCIDMGVGIGAANGHIEYIAGRVQMLSAGLPCLVCTDKLDAEQVRREMLTQAQRTADPYIRGESVPQPAVISLNSTMASAAVTMFLAAVTGIPSAARMLTYDGMHGTLRAAAMQPRPHCITCSEDGALARGASWTLPTRSQGE
jgi:molybdopterin-synthase adenylyltransferase